MLVHVVFTPPQGKEKPDFCDFFPMNIKMRARRSMLSLACISNFVSLDGSAVAKVVGEAELRTQ